MAKKKMEENLNIENQEEMSSLDVLIAQKKESEEDVKPFNPLKKERVIVRYIDNGKFPNPKHVFHGGLASKATINYCVPCLSNGTFVNPLTTAEKAFFEDILGLEKNALSVYIKGNNNFWSTANHSGVGTVALTKQDNYFDLSNPVDWLKVRVLEMQKGEIAKSYKELRDNPATDYRFVIIHDSSEVEQKKNRQYYTKEAWKLLGKIEEDKCTMKYIIEKLEKKPISISTKLQTLSTKCGDLIEQNAMKFHAVITDEMLETKVLLSKCVEKGLISRRNGFYYTKEGQPMCEANQNSTEEVAAEWLHMPKNQDLYFILQEESFKEN